MTWGLSSHPKGKKIKGTWVGAIASGCLVLTLSVQWDRGSFFSRPGSQPIHLSHPWSLLGCVAFAPCSRTLKGSPSWPRLVSPSTSLPRSPSRAPVCKCTTACTISQTVSKVGVYACVCARASMCTPFPFAVLRCTEAFMRLGHSEGAAHVCVCTSVHTLA